MSSGFLVRRDSLALFLIGFVTFALLYAVQALLPAFASDFQVSAADSALALSVSTGMLALSILLSAVVARRMDRRRLMLGAILAATLLNGVSAMSTQWWQVLICRALLGVCLGAVPATAMAYLGDTVPSRQLARAMGLYVAGTAMGGMTGRVGIALVSDPWGWRAGLLGMSILCLLALAGMVRMMPADDARSGAGQLQARLPLLPWRELLIHPRLSRLFACGGLASGIFVTAYNYASFHLLGEPFSLRPAQVGLVFLCYLFGVASSGLSGRLVEASGSARVLRGACVLTAVGVGLSLVLHIAAFVLGLCLMTAGFFALHAVCSGLVGKESGPHKAQATSIYLLAYYIGSSVLGYAGGWLWGHGGWPWLCGGLLAALAVFMALLRTLERQPETMLNGMRPEAVLSDAWNAK